MQVLPFRFLNLKNERISHAVCGFYCSAPLTLDFSFCAARFDDALALFIILFLLFCLSDFRFENMRTEQFILKMYMFFNGFGCNLQS